MGTNKRLASRVSSWDISTTDKWEGIKTAWDEWNAGMEIDGSIQSMILLKQLLLSWDM